MKPRTFLTYYQPKKDSGNDKKFPQKLTARALWWIPFCKDNDPSPPVRLRCRIAIDCWRKC